MIVTDLTPLHADRNPELRDAVEAAVPGYRAVTAALARCAEVLAARRRDTGRAARDDLVARVAADLAAGRDVPAGLGADAYTAVHASALAQAAVEVLTQVEESLAADRDDATRGAVDGVLRHLNGRLQATVTAARALPLRGAQTADAAIAAGVTGAWTQLGQLRGTYVQVRAAQHRVMAALADAEHVATFGFVANYAQLFPGWARAARGEHLDVDAATRTATAIRQPWPDDHPGRFAWLVAHPQARPWVPTRRQLREAVQAAHAASETVADLTPQATPA